MVAAPTEETPWIAAGDESQKYSMVARQQLPWLYSLARRLLGDAAEDTIRECLVTAYRDHHTLHDGGDAAHSFRRILLNCVRDRYRRVARLPAAEPVEEPQDAAPHHGLANRDRSSHTDRVGSHLFARFDEADVWRVLDRVSLRYRVPLVLVYMEGMSVDQVAQLLDVAENTVLSSLPNGRELLRRALRDDPVAAQQLAIEKTTSRPIG